MNSVRPIELLPAPLDDESERDDVALLIKPATPALDDLPPSETMIERLKRLAGLGYIVFGAFNISLMSTCAKYATHYVTSHEAVFWRSVLSFALNYLFVRVHHVDLKLSRPHAKYQLLRCIFGTLSICFQFYAMSKMVLTDAIMIVFTSPAFTFALGAIVLCEAIDHVDLAAALFSYTGVIFVTRPAFLFPSAHADATAHDSARTAGILAAMAAAITQACSYIAIRKLHDVHYIASIHYFTAFGIVFSAAMLAIFQVPLRIPELWSVRAALAAAAFFATIGLHSITIGFQREKAGIASVMRYFDVLFVILWDATFLGEHIHPLTLLGGAILLSGASVIAYRKAHNTKK